MAALGVSYLFGGVPRLNSVKSLAKYALFAVILAPVSVASAAARALEGDSWWIGFLTEALALLTLTPAILGWVDIALTRVKKPKAHYIEAHTVVGWISDIRLFHVCGIRQSKPTSNALFVGAISAVGGLAVWNHRSQQFDRTCRLSRDFGCRTSAWSFHRRHTRKRCVVFATLLAGCRKLIHGVSRCRRGTQSSRAVGSEKARNGCDWHNRRLASELLNGMSDGSCYLDAGNGGNVRFAAWRLWPYQSCFRESDSSRRSD